MIKGALLLATKAGVLVATLAVTAFAQTLPGEALASPNYAGAIFAEACMKTRPRYRNADRVLEANGLVKIPTGTFYHTEFDMSVKPQAGVGCSVVFRLGANFDPKTLTEAFAGAVEERASVSPGDVTIDISRISADRAYLAARTTP
ncbi:MAG: hypothetical protein AAGO57_00045 [Pseudomonadota bacterium]